MVSGFTGHVSASAGALSERAAADRALRRVINMLWFMPHSGDQHMLQHGKRPTIASRHGMVAAAHPLAAAAGARVLSNGGNAFDAAAATAATLNVVEPYMSGLAGRGVATCYIAEERRVRTLDFVAPIPQKFPIEKLSQREQVLRGPLGVGAPGNLAGWCELVQSYGRKKLPELFA